MARRRPAWPNVLAMLAWALLLGWLPWWLGLPLLLALAAGVSLLQPQLAPDHSTRIRSALRWGLPGWLFALLRALGGDVLGWGAALLGALVGYTLLAGLEAWLDRELRRAPAAAATADWAELALTSIGPPAEIIELQPPSWQAARGDLPDPLGGSVRCSPEGCRFPAGELIAAPGSAAGFAQIGFSPAARWFAGYAANQPVLILWDRVRDRQHRLRGWQLCGWYREQPWLSRREDDMPQSLHVVLGNDDDD